LARRTNDGRMVFVRRIGVLSEHVFENQDSQSSSNTSSYLYGHHITFLRIKMNSTRTLLPPLRTGLGLRPYSRLITSYTPLSRSSTVCPVYAISSTRSFATSSYLGQKPLTSKPEHILPQQRLHRPVSPHLGIYRLNINYFLSPSNRIAAVILTAPFYVFGSAYLVSPLFDWDLSSASMAAAFGTLPVAAKVAVKLFFALPFAMHCLNGVRHLMWDTAKGLTNMQTQRSGWIVAGLSVISALTLALI